MFETGFWTIGRWRGVPIRLHWSIPLGALLFGGFRFVPGFWLGFVLLVIVHELGHAALARARRLEVYEVRVHGFGGVCIHRSGSAYDGAIIAWGGVLAQMLVLFVPALVLARLAPPRELFWVEMLHAFTAVNLWIAALNLLPIPPLDGAKAWTLPKLWWQRRARRKTGHRAPPPPASPATKTKAAATKAVATKAAATKTAAPRPNGADAEDPAAAAQRLAREALESARRRS